MASGPVCDCACKTDSMEGIIYCPLHKAAPEMLEALKEIVEVRGCSCTADTIRIWQAAKAAIAAAEGKGGE